MMNAPVETRSWSAVEVHEALIRWGCIAARMDDGGRGYPSTSIGLVELRQRPYQALGPTDFSDGEFDVVAAAVQALDQPLKVIVLCYYKPGHLRSVAPLGVDGKGRARAPSIRSIASVMSVSHRVIETRLQAARAAVQRHLTRSG